MKTTCPIAPNGRNGTAGLERLYEELASQKERIAKLEIELRTHGAAETLSPQASSGGMAIAVDARRTIQINVFGGETVAHLTEERVGQLLLAAAAPRGGGEVAPGEAALAALLEAASLVYSDPDHPENITCYLPNKKRDEALVHKELGWEVQPIQLVLPPMMARTVETLFEKQPKLAPELTDTELDRCGQVLIALRDQPLSIRLAAPGLRGVLVRNKTQLERLLRRLPVAGDA